MFVCVAILKFIESQLLQMGCLNDDVLSVFRSAGSGSGGEPE